MYGATSADELLETSSSLYHSNYWGVFRLYLSPSFAAFGLVKAYRFVKKLFSVPMNSGSNLFESCLPLICLSDSATVGI